ncbi:MAG: TerC family protein [Armatimonadetes bacterium]|nr:TerC family protein [Armatimonadota bacterium]
MSTQLLLWVIFGAIVGVMLVLDLGVFHRKGREESLRSAGVWTIVWVALALGFNAGVYAFKGPQAGLEFVTGYLVEWSLSMDNVFVFALLFSFFCVPKEYQHRVLFWGILGAIVMRLSFILLGAALLERFHWVIYIFGAIVLVAGIRMFRHKDEEIHPDRNPVLRLACRHLRVTPGFAGDRFFVRENGAWLATPLFLVLLVVEATDVVFAVDSVPAIFAITRDPFIVFTSNVFAILGLRALYFLLAGVIGMFHYLTKGLSFVLCFIGVKMLITDLLHIPTAVSLGVVVLILGGSVVLSLLFPQAEPEAEEPTECPVLPLAVACPLPEAEAEAGEAEAEGEGQGQ